MTLVIVESMEEAAVDVAVLEVVELSANECADEATGGGGGGA